VTFHVNKPFPEIVKIFGNASYGMHTMEAEHFGITCVEMLAAGIILVAHNSAGPKVDIIK
jgi:alpha-1,2-mannosyltransferase